MSFSPGKATTKEQGMADLGRSFKKQEFSTDLRAARKIEALLDSSPPQVSREFWLQAQHDLHDHAQKQKKMADAGHHFVIASNKDLTALQEKNRSHDFLADLPKRENNK